MKTRKRMAKVRLTLTKRSVDGLLPSARPWIAWDDKLTGFGIRVQPSGTKSFLINYRADGGGRYSPNRRLVIGRYGRVTAEQARRKAQALLGRVAAGEDPAVERAQARGLPTLGEAFEEYIEANPNRTQRTVYLYRQNLRVNLPDWVNRPLSAISRRDVEARFHRITDKHGWAGANQTMSMLRSIYRRPCVDYEGLRNPVELWLAAGGRFHRMRRRKISAPSEVLPRWAAGIEAVEMPEAVRDILWIGLYTGMRLGEVNSLQWERIDLERLILRVEETKTGEVLELPITNQLAGILEHRKAEAEITSGGSARGIAPRPRMGVSVNKEPVGAHRGHGAVLCGDQQSRRDKILVSWIEKQFHLRGRAGVDAAEIAGQAAGEPRPRRRCHRGLCRGLDRGAATQAGATRGGSDRRTEKYRTGSAIAAIGSSSQPNCRADGGHRFGGSYELSEA